MGRAIRGSAPRPMSRDEALKSSGGSGNTPNIDPSTVTKTVSPGLQSVRERILLAGDTNAGKSYTYMRMAQLEFERAKAEGTVPANFYIIDTDNTTPTFLSPGFEFEQLYFGNGGNVFPYSSNDWETTAASFADIYGKAKVGDWIVFDVINRMYDQAQTLVAESMGISSVQQAAFDRASTKAGFGAFGTDGWMQVRRVHDAVMNKAVYQSPANLLCVSHVAETVDSREKREVLFAFDSIGMKPAGSPRVPGMLNSIIMLWNELKITRGEKNRRTGAEQLRHLTVVKDRGRTCNVDRVYEGDAWTEFLAIRQEK